MNLHLLHVRRAALVLAILSSQAQAQTNQARTKLDTYLNQIGYAQVEQRARTVAAIHTREEADQRKSEVRAKVLKLIGGLPESHGPVPVKEFGSVAGPGFRVEKVAYQSLPNFYVTANVYVPANGPGPFPAVIVTPGHGPNGKLGEYSWGANLARAGIITLAVDTFGQGERLQHYDPELEASKIESGGEHEHASLSAELLGDHVSRYFVNDGIRGVDYLTQRKDVDAAHIGAFGCSGGGTVTAYLAALDPRISVAATACYITSFKELLPTRGPQDAEQTIPRFLAEGLDLADWVELAAPRPYAIVSTTEDMFPYAGARATYDEAKRIYSLYDASGNLQWITGPGGHGNLGPISQQILDFLVKHLKNGASAPTFTPSAAENPDDLLATPSGQVSTSLGGETVESVNRKTAVGRTAPQTVIAGPGDLPAFQTRIRATIRAAAALTAQPGDIPQVDLLTKEQRDGYHVQTISLHSEPGLEIAGLIAVPDRPGPKPIVVMMDSLARERALATRDFERLAKSGHIVVFLEPRGYAGDTPPGQASNFVLGGYMGTSLRAMIVGKSIVGMRVDDTIRAISWLSSLPDTDKASVTLYGKGPLGIVALHAAAVDPRITHVVVENTLTSYRMALNGPLHRNLAESLVPGVLRHYDIADLLEAISPRPVLIANPVNAIGAPVRADAFRKELQSAFDSDRNLGTPQRIRLVRRGFRDPLPID